MKDSFARGVLFLSLLLSFPAFSQSFTRSQLSSQNNQYFYSNGQGRVSAPVVNSMDGNIISSMGILGDINAWTGVNSWGGTSTFNGSSIFNGSITLNGSIFPPVVSSGNALVFPVESYGATTTAHYHSYGDASLTGFALHSASAAFTAGDVGDDIEVWYAGTAGTIATPATASAADPTKPHQPGTVYCIPRGSLAAAAWNIRISYAGSGGETLASTRFTINCNAGELPQVYSPIQVYGAQTWNIYMSTASNTETKQNPWPLGIGQPFWASMVGVIPGAALPVGNTTAIIPPLKTTILSVQGPNDVTLTAAAGTSVSGGNFEYGKDQLAAFNTALAACSAAGGGVVSIGAQYVISSGTLTLPDKCSILGPNFAFGNQGSRTGYPDTGPALILDPVGGNTIKLGNSSGLGGLGVYEFGLPNPNSLAADAATRLGIDGITGFSGAGITANAGSSSGAQIRAVYEAGFETCAYDYKGGRWTVDGWWVHCNNGAQIIHNHDAPSYWNNTELFVFYGANSTWNSPTYDVTGVANAGGSIQITVVPDDVSGLPSNAMPKVGDTVIIKGNNRKFSGMNDRWTIGATDGAGTITLADSQYAPVTTGNWTSGAQVAILTSLNSLGINQTITCAASCGIGPGDANTIIGINRITNKVMLQYPTTASQTGMSVTMTNPAFAVGATLEYKVGRSNGTAFYIADGGGVMFDHTNSEGWWNSFWIEQTDPADKIRNIKLCNTVTDDEFDPVAIALVFTRATSLVFPGTVQWCNAGTTSGPGAAFLVDIGTGSPAVSATLQILGANFASMNQTQVIGTVLTGKAQIATPNFPVSGTKNFIEVSQFASGLYLGEGAIQKSYIAVDSVTQRNVFSSSDSAIGSSSWGAPPITSLTTPIMASFPNANPPSTAVIQYGTPVTDNTAAGNATNNSRNGVGAPWPIAGTFTGIVASMSGVSAGGYTVGLANSGSISALACALTAAVPTCSDLTDTFTVAAGDVVADQFVPVTAGGGTTIGSGQVAVSSLFTSANSNEGVLLGGFPSANMSTTVAQNAPIGTMKAWVATASEINVSNVMAAPGTVDTLYAAISGVAGVGAGYVFTVFKNGIATVEVAGDGSTTCGGASSTLCSDTAGCTPGALTCSHAVHFVRGDTISIQQCPTNAAGCLAGSAPTARSARVGVRWVPDVQGQTLMMANQNGATGTGARFGPVSGGTAWSTTEANEENLSPLVPASMTVSNMIMAQSAAPCTPAPCASTRIVTLADSGGTPFAAPSPSGLSVAMTASTTLTIGGVALTPATGDIADTEIISPKDYLDYQMVTSGSQVAVTWMKLGAVVTVP